MRCHQATSHYPNQWWLTSLTHVCHYTDVIMGTIACLKSPASPLFTQPFYSDADQRKYQSSALLAFVGGIHRRPVNSPHKWPVTRNIFPFERRYHDSQALMTWLVHPWANMVDNSLQMHFIQWQAIIIFQYHYTNQFHGFQLTTG